jgi:hypothetical protein
MKSWFRKLVAYLQVCLICYLTYVATCMLVWGEVVMCLLCLKNPSFNRINLLLKIYWNLILDSKHVCFQYSLIRWYWVIKCLWPVYACMLIGCFYFSGDRFERRVCGGGRCLWISRRRRSGTSQPRQAIYLLHIWILSRHYALFYSALTTMHCFSYIANYP